MRIKSKKSAFSLARILCFVFGHRFRVSREVTAHIKEYRCTCCRAEVTLDDEGHITSLTSQLKEINDTLTDLHKKKRHSSSAA
ncbi:hypothetical protein [Sinomicrobium soli]|uniref:hypothetical protein n=1 Tax=Sinomicrobium sp. N-1-3-6 TaxID=2219864 RepID=UPI000DCC8123|nr:hypothetical protein [Sinomicrobium sp. N-1-3-6]RAV28277.1 hypothetical protein DN748_14040 [Sinomicrobium sp. N-1-3-6]